MTTRLIVIVMSGDCADEPFRPPEGYIDANLVGLRKGLDQLVIVGQRMSSGDPEVWVELLRDVAEGKNVSVSEESTSCLLNGAA